MKFSAGLFLLFLAFCGCSGSGDQKTVYEVTGKVTLAGGPVPKATVIFSPLENQPVATGITDNKGVYRLTTYDSFDGAAAGKYDVLVSKSAVPAAGAEPAHDPTGSATGNSAPGHDAAAAESDDGVTLDPKYSKPGNGLTADVKTDGNNVIDLKLE